MRSLGLKFFVSLKLDYLMPIISEGDPKLGEPGEAPNSIKVGKFPIVLRFFNGFN